MTLKEFSRAYNVPYHIVYESSYKVTPQSTWLRDRDYPEHEVYNAVIDTIRKRIAKHRNLLERQTEIMERLEGCDEMSKVRRESKDL